MDERTTAWYSLHVKSIDEEQRLITGIATTPEPDRQGDIIDPLGAMYAAEIPLLLHHDTKSPVGSAQLGIATPLGIPFTAWIKTIAEPGIVRDRVNEAWHLVKAGLLKGVSIGYGAKKEWIEPLLSGGRLFSKSEILELSLVTIGMNPHALITGIKALDLAASGLTPSAVAEIPHSRSSIMETPTLQEQIKSFQDERAPLHDQMSQLMTDRRDPLDDAETKTYDELSAKVHKYDATIARLMDLEKANMAAAQPLMTLAKSSDGARPMPAPYTRVRVKANVPPGTAFMRMVCARVVCKGNQLEAAEYAKRWDDSTPEVALYLKAAISAGTATDATWAGPLVQPNISTEFVQLLRPQTALGKIPGLRRVPFNTKVPAQTGGGVYQWVGETKPKPVTKLAFSSVTLPWSKTAGIIVITEELAKLSTPKAEDLCRADMIAGIAQFLDNQFFDPTITVVANVRPASVTNGVTGTASTGPLGDIVTIANAFTLHNVPLDQLVIVMSPNNALVLSFQTDSMGNRRFPDMTASGGTVSGIPVITTKSAGTNIIGLAPSLILLAEDDSVSVDVSREASLQMSDTPMDPADATTIYVSLWQNNYVGLRAEQFITWLKAHVDAVQLVTGATYTIPAGQMALEGGAAATATKNHKTA